MCAACAAWRCCFFLSDFFHGAKSKQANFKQTADLWIIFGWRGRMFLPHLLPPPHPKFGSAVGVCSQSFAGSGQTGSPKRSLVFSTKKSHGSQVWDLETLGCDALISCDFLSKVYGSSWFLELVKLYLCVFLFFFCVFLSVSLLLFFCVSLYLRLFRVSPVCILRLELQEKLAVSLDTAACTVSWCRHWGSKSARAQEGKQARCKNQHKLRVKLCTLCNCVMNEIFNIQNAVCNFDLFILAGRCLIHGHQWWWNCPC